MRQYLDLMSDVRTNGILKEQRAVLLSTRRSLGGEVAV